MKKVLASMLLVLACGPSYCLDWTLPTVTMRYEIAGGSEEDPDDDTLEASSLRHTASVRVKEEADPATFGVELTASTKDYYRESGDYTYLKIAHDGAVRVSEPLKLGYSLGAKWLTFSEPDSDGLSKDALSLSAGTSATVRLAAGTSMEAGLLGRFTLAANPQDARQAFQAGAGLSSRIGDWLVSTRYRGELRLPLGADAVMSPGLYGTASVSLTWDPR